MSEARLVPGMGSRFVDTPSRRIHVWTAGEGDPAVLLHGFTDDGSCWVGAVPLFGERGFRVVAPDARAHGRTPLLADDEFTAAARVADTVAVMAALDIDDALIAGHSMGAVTAMQLAAHHRPLVRAVLLIDPPLRDGEPQEQSGQVDPFEAWISEIAAMDVDALTDRCRSESPTWSPAEVDAWVASKKSVDERLFRRARSWHEEPWRETLDSIEVPVLLVAGEPRFGSIVDETAGRWLDRHPNIDFVRIGGAGHSVHRDAALEFATAVRRFFEDRL